VGFFSPYTNPGIEHALSNMARSEVSIDISTKALSNKSTAWFKFEFHPHAEVVMTAWDAVYEKRPMTPVSGVLKDRAPDPYRVLPDKQALPMAGAFVGRHFDLCITVYPSGRAVTEISDTNVVLRPIPDDASAEFPEQSILFYLRDSAKTGTSYFS